MRNINHDGHPTPHSLLTHSHSILFSISSKNLGASSRTRTNDRWITNLVLYQLSYRGGLLSNLRCISALRDCHFMSFKPCSAEKRCKGTAFFGHTKIIMQKKCKKRIFIFPRARKHNILYPIEKQKTKDDRRFGPNRQYPDFRDKRLLYILPPNGSYQNHKTDYIKECRD